MRISNDVVYLGVSHDDRPHDWENHEVIDHALHGPADDGDVNKNEQQKAPIVSPNMKARHDLRRNAQESHTRHTEGRGCVGHL